MYGESEGWCGSMCEESGFHMGPQNPLIISQANGDTIQFTKVQGHIIYSSIKFPMPKPHTFLP